MFKNSHLRIYRKFFILAVLLGGLYFSLSFVPPSVGASSCGDPRFPLCCCSECTYLTNECINNNGCYNYPPGPLRNACIGDCFDQYTECRMYCDGLC